MRNLLKQYAIIAFGGVVFASIILLPFLRHSSEQFFVAVSTAPISGCIVQQAERPVPNQCMGWGAPHDMWLIGIAGFVLLMLSMFVQRWYVHSVTSRSQLYKFVTQNLYGAIVVAGLVAGTYWYMHLHGQAQIVAALPPLHGKLWVPASPQPFGPGLMPATVVLFTAIYLSHALMLWYTLLGSPWRIVGIKKDKLFQ